MLNYSFWADEGYVSGIAKQLISGQLDPFNLLNSPGITYQKLQILVLSFFFKFFGVSEFSARLPSFIAFLIGIIVIFLLAKKLSNNYGGLLSAFLYGFSHLNLAYATQAKPYSALETILLIILYLLIQKKVNHLLVIFFCSIATLLHSIGVLIWGVYFTYLVLKLKSLKVLLLTTFKSSNPLTSKFFNLLTLFTVIIAIFILILPIVNSSLDRGIFPYNHLYQFIKLFVYKYFFITVLAFFGFIWSFKKNKNINISIAIYSVVVFFMATFKAYIFNIRYVLSLYGILFLYFGIFWTKVGERYKNNFQFSIFNFQFNGRSIIPIAVIIILYATGYKIIRFPQAYYNPNIDKYGDVQIANYKDFYKELKKRFPNYKKLYVINNIFDIEYWYFGRYSNAYFTKFTLKPIKHHAVNAMIYGSLDDFKKIIKDHPQGLLIMEDWQSLLPDDVKEYAKQKLKLEFRIESLKETPDDPWPLVLYSWGKP